MGPITLATILARRGFDVSVYNENISGPLDENPSAYADVCSADVVGLSIMTATATRGYIIAKSIRRDAPGATLAFGGVHATFLPEEALEHGDLVVCGEAETVIEDIALGKITSGIVRPEPLDHLDELPPLDHFLVQDFDRLIEESRRRDLLELPMATSRGCPYACTYCSVSWMFGRKIRRQSVEKVHRDMQYYASRGFRAFFIYDDNFTSDRAWTTALLERIRPMHLRYMAQSRVDFHWKDAARTERDDHLLKALRLSGCNALLLGYETIDQKTAEHWRKGYRGNHSLAARLAEDSRILHDQGIWLHGMFIMGPQHTQDTLEGTLDFARRCQLESIQVGFLTPFPGTPLYDEMRPRLILDHYPEDWEYYDGTHVIYDHTRLGLEGMSLAVLDTHRRFYRFGGWNLRSLKVVARRPLSAADKLVDFWTRISKNVGLFDNWQAEMEDYFAFVRSRTKNNKR